MNYFNPVTKERISHKQLCDKFNASIPASIEEYEGWFKLVYGNRPNSESYQTVNQNSEPELVDGKFELENKNISLKFPQKELQYMLPIQISALREAVQKFY